MTSAKQWQQPRTGKVRRRLQYSNLFHTSGDHDVISVVRPDDSSQSSNDKMALAEINISDMDNILTGSITGRNIHSKKRESGDEASAMGSLSQSTNLESSDCPDAVNSIANVVQVDSDADLSHCEKAFKHNETRNLSQHLNLEIQPFGQMHADHVNVSLSAKGHVSAKDEELEQRRGRRKRKPKVPFEEDERTSRKSQKKLRRIKIMRHLGLAAPHGSPFISNCVVRTAA